MPPRPVGTLARFLWSLDMVGRAASGHRPVMHEDVEAAREGIRDRRRASEDAARDAVVLAPARVSPGSPFVVGPAVNAALSAYCLPPVSGRDVAGACPMVWHDIGQRDGPVRPCEGSPAYVADLGYRGGTSRLPVCAAHAHQLVTQHERREGMPTLTLHSLHPSVGHGIPPGYLGAPL